MNGQNNHQTPAPRGGTEQNTGLVVIPAERNIATVEFNGVECTEDADKLEAVRQFLRSKMLRQYGVNEVKGMEIPSGKLAMNGICTSLKLPKPITNPQGVAIESLPAYYERCKKAIVLWLLQSFHNSGMTVDQIKAIG